MPTVCHTTHHWCEDLTWEKNVWKLVWVPLISQGVIALLMPCIGALWKKSGLQTRQYEALLGMSQSVQLMLSIAYVFIWIDRSYRYKVDAASRIAEIVMSVVFIPIYFLNASIFDFNWTCAWRLTAVVDVVTVSSLFADPHFGHRQWLGWGFLRGYRALRAFERLEQVWLSQDCKHPFALRTLLIGDGLSDITRASLVFLLRFGSTTVLFIGTVITLEILGDPRSITEWDEKITTDMGDINYFQMVYWMTTVMSTVGYGDFSPKTVLDRLFIIIAFVVGIIFFGNQLDEIQTIQELEETGGGRYIASVGTRSHLVVIGGGVARPGVLLSAFICELYNDQYLQTDWPDACLMSSSEKPEELGMLLDEMSYDKSQHVQYFVGDTMAKVDMERVYMQKARFVLVLPSMEVADKEQEDDEGILRALAIKRAYPQINIRLTLLLPQSRSKLEKCGIPHGSAFSFDLLRGSLLAQSCLCRGWSTMMTNLVMSTSANSVLQMDSATSSHKRATWFLDYMRGYEMEIFGFTAKGSHAGVSFGIFAQKALASGVLPFALQIDGKIVLNPIQFTLERDSVVFAMAPDADALYKFADFSGDWVSLFRKRRGKMQQIKKAAVAVKQMMSPSIIGQDGSTFDRKDAQGIASHGFDSASEVKSRVTRKAELFHFVEMDGDDTDTLSVQQLQEYEARSQQIIGKGGHIVVALLSKCLWQQAHIFLDAYRSQRLPFIAPVVLITRAVPSQRIVNDVIQGRSLVSFMIGDPESTSDLVRAGVHNAHQIIVLNNGLERVNEDEESDPTSNSINCLELQLEDVVPAEAHMADGGAVVAMSSTETIHKEHEKALPVIAEFVDMRSVRLLNSMPASVASKVGVSARDAPEEMTTALLNLDSFENECDVEAIDFFCHPRFASGDLCVMNCLGSLSAASYYRPGLVEVVMNLVRGSDYSQTSQPWQIVVPTKFAGRMYGELVTEFVNDPWYALCLGVYRQRFPGIAGTHGPGYVMTNPPMTTVLQADDLITLLGSPKFGERCYQQGLLANVTGPAVGQAVQYEMALKSVSKPREAAKLNAYTSDLSSAKKASPRKEAYTSSISSNQKTSQTTNSQSSDDNPFIEAATKGNQKNSDPKAKTIVLPTERAGNRKQTSGKKPRGKSKAKAASPQKPSPRA